MPLIIDGYNLLCSCGFVGERVGPGSLERARGLFLGWLCDVFGPEELSEVTVIFDSVLRIPELPDQYLHKGIKVCFATGHQDADEMIIQIIEREATPKMLIVSSDHQIQNAAKRKKCSFEDSDRWFERIVAEKSSSETVRKSSQELKTELTLQKKSNDQALNETETQRWLAQFLPDAVKPTAASADKPNSTSAASPVAATTSPAETKPSRQSPKSKTQRFSTTNFDDLAKAKRTETPQAHSPAKKPAADGISKSDTSDALPASASEKVRLDSIEDNYEAPELNLGQSFAQSELKNSMLIPDDIDGWLDDFDQQFLKAGLEIPRTGVRKENDSPSINVHQDSHRSIEKSKEPPEELSNDTQNQSQAKPEKSEASQRSAVGKDVAREVSKEQDSVTTTGSSDSPGSKRPPIDVDNRQLDRWNRQLEETDSEIFPPGYAEDILFAETFETDERLKRKRRK